jgi:hypothetical protein
METQNLTWALVQIIKVLKNTSTLKTNLPIWSLGSLSLLATASKSSMQSPTF